MRRIDPQTGTVTIVANDVYPAGMLSSSADGKCIAHAQNISGGPLSIYNVTTHAFTNPAYTLWYNLEVGANRDCTQFAVPANNGATFIFDGSLNQLPTTIGTYDGGGPMGVAYHPTSDIVYFAWTGTTEVRAFDTKTLSQIASFDAGDTFVHTDNNAFTQGRLKLSRDGSLLFATVTGGVRCLGAKLNPVVNARSLFVNTVTATAITLTGRSPRQLPLTYSIVAQPAHGTLQGTPPNVSYTPDAAYSGQDSFTFKATDGTLESNQATVTITIDKQVPVINSFSLPASASSLNVAISNLAAGDNVGITGYCLSESTDPANCTWSSTPPTSYHFGSMGSHTLHAFARDASGNVSAPAGATINIPEILPRITALTIPPTYGYNNLTIPVVINASDDLGVTGYCLTEAATSGACNWYSWPPSSYTFAAAGPHTLYAFVRNTTGKISPPASATTAVVGQVNFIPAPGRADMVYDDARGVLYITSGTSVLRYKFATNSFLTPYQFSLGDLSGVDLSPDGNTLAIADRNITGIHLVDLQTDTIKPDILFTPASNEAGTYTVAYGNDGALLVTTMYNGSGRVPLRRVNPATGAVTIINSEINQDSMLSGSADGKCIGYAEGNISSGPLSIYDVASQKATNTVETGQFTFELGTNRDCTQFAFPTQFGAYIYNKYLIKIATIGSWAGPNPIGIVYHPLSDIVYFALIGTKEVRAYDTAAFSQIASYDFGYTFPFQTYVSMRISRDGTLLFGNVGDGIQDGIHYQRISFNAPVADDQLVVAYQDIPRPITLTGSSPKHAALTFTIVTPPAHGTVQGTAPNLSYTPNNGYTGQDTVTFKASDGTLDSNIATITLTVKPIPANVAIHPPTVSGQLTLTWTNPNCDFSHIHIYRSTVAGKLGTLMADNLTGTTYTDTGLAYQTIYYYTVRFVDVQGNESNNTAQVSSNATAYFLTTKIAGNGTVNNIEQTPPFSCAEASCTSSFAAGTVLLLGATPSSLYTFGGWSGGGCSGTDDCSVTLTADTTITATFGPLPLVQITGSTVPYQSLQAAFAAVADQGSLKARNVTLSENFIFNRPISITLTGGLNSDFMTINGYTVFQGLLTLQSGSLTLENFVIR